MKKHFVFIVLIVFSSMIISSCGTGGSGTVPILDDSFNPVNLKISLLSPIFKFGSAGTIDDESVLNIGKMIYNSLESRIPAKWMSPEESIALIQNAKKQNEYESFLNDYQKTWIPDNSKLIEISESVNCPYIALCQIDHRVTGSDATSHYRLTGITIQVISANSGKVVLELVGNAECGSGGHDIGAVKLIQKAIDEAISKYPGAKPLSS
jgi:hypothetical protein